MVAYGLPLMGYSAAAGAIGYGTKAINNHYYGAHGAAAWEWLGAGLNLAPAVGQIRATSNVGTALAAKAMGTAGSAEAATVAATEGAITNKSWATYFTNKFSWSTDAALNTTVNSSTAKLMNPALANNGTFKTAVSEAIQESWNSGYRGLGNGVEGAATKIANKVMDTTVRASTTNISTEVFDQLQTIARGAARDQINGALKSQAASAFSSSAKMEFNNLAESTADTFLSPSKTPEKLSSAKTPAKTTSTF